MTIDEAKNLILFAKGNGIRKLKFDNLEIELEPLTKMVGESISTDGIGQGQYVPTEDEMLLYSTPHFDELIADRKGV